MDRDWEDPPAGEPGNAQYVNYLQVGRTEHEIILEFGQFHAGDARPRILTRLVTHPAYAGEFLLVLADALRQTPSNSDTPQ